MSGEEWAKLPENVSKHIGYTLPDTIHKKFQNFFSALNKDNIPEQLEPIKERNLINPIYYGLLACHYHKDNIQKLEDEIIALAKKHIPYNSPYFNGAFGGGNTGKVTIEYQSFIMAEKHLLEYVTKCITAFLNTPEIKDFSVLQRIRKDVAVNIKAEKIKDIREKLYAHPKIIDALEKYEPLLEEIYYNENGETYRNKVSHYAPLEHNQIGITIGPKGAVGIYYTGYGDLPLNVNDMDHSKSIFLIQQEKGYVAMPDPLLPLLIRRLETLQSFVFDVLNAINRTDISDIC